MSTDTRTETTPDRVERGSASGPAGPPSGAMLPALGHPARGRELKDQLARIVMWLAFLLALVPLIWILWTVVSKGIHLVVEAEWWTNSQKGITSRREGGGAVHAIQGTLIQGVTTAVISVPIGIMTAIYLVEYGRGRFAKAVSFMVDILTGVPSIVAGLFVYAVWVTTFGFQRVGFAVCLALVLLMIPVIVRSTEEMLKLVPNELREASYALGVPKWKTIARVVLPTAFSGIITGVLLGLARVMGETAPLLILGPYTKSIATDLFGGYMATLPTMINQDRTESLQPAIDRVWAAALTLIFLVLLLNLAGRVIARFGSVKK
ncbi:phosphate ABC transporter membrane protein 2, PhoT family [Pedococcus dokdonensis]|uniref:Phosphate transport system permease protein PstA n=1 Tax=Pedococcus dokdonensis TaxID=443156 RepID=A0A1H0SYE0_9MICO|nr:phosphate ABC transporter permease PstA [Pedococcus dokdonensis]SDP46218.1 phosphate ABC transporter membrane protein 2, PhoT family [Pedococcus dokdonensis]